VNGGAEKAQKAAGTWAEKKGNGMARRVRDQMDTQTCSLLTAEEKIVQHVRENPGLYVIAIALVIGALLAKLIIEARETRQAPLL